MSGSQLSAICAFVVVTVVACSVCRYLGVPQEWLHSLHFVGGIALGVFIARRLVD